jgi:hypothetical protein
MNDMNEQQLKRMLEEATASDHAGTSPLRSSEQSEPEAAGLRDAWLAFGRLLEAADAEQSGSWRPESIQPKEPLRKQPAKRSRRLAEVAVTAAAVLVAVGIGWWMSHGGPNGAGGPNGGGGPAVVKDNSKQGTRDTVATKPNVPVSNEPAPVVANNDASKPKQEAAQSSSWDDPIDTQIAAVSQEIDTVRQNWQHRTDDVDLVQYRIDEVSDGLPKDTL